MNKVMEDPASVHCLEFKWLLAYGGRDLHLIIAYLYELSHFQMEYALPRMDSTLAELLSPVEYCLFPIVPKLLTQEHWVEE